MIDGLNRALDYIESNLSGEIETAEMARLATTSEYHFRRMFSALAAFPYPNTSVDVDSHWLVPSCPSADQECWRPP